MMEKKPAVLVLENGQYFEGYSFGSSREALGEVCFNTSMAGYQEILTDPSYCGQLVTLTYPMIGNYGVHPEYAQSNRIQAEALIVKRYVNHPSNHMAEKTLQQYLLDEDTPAIERIDTRKLVLMLRNEGAMRGGLFPGKSFSQDLLEKVQSIPGMLGLDLVSRVSAEKPYIFGEKGGKYRIAVVDFGVKTNILRLLNQSGFEVHVFPASTSIDDLKNFDAYFLSNGPGDPEPVSYGIETARALLNSGKPVFGICLGHQIIGLAKGWKTFKLKFGHRGGNQPVKEMKSGKVEITAQNHGFAVEASESEKSLNVSHLNLNDQTIEGFYNDDAYLITVQHHPEASPGPNDSAHMFSDFFTLVDKYYQSHERAS
ncbi:MAG: glutamine-hydrolyzing carbamoyl-phosphate synthase small subunit [Leptospiraceae bacterium]|nr:glutamine-hydrolyzing carbamoyl-phosphate synthase small subunit [Leptospiraceae bacterium]